jgi:hypothetical protein
MESRQDAHGVVSLLLSPDESLVLFEWIHRNEDEDNDLATAGVRDEAERRVLWDLSCCLERHQVEPLQATYATQLESARARLRPPVDDD